MKDDENARIHPVTCQLCEATCGLRVEARDDEVLRIVGDEADPFSRGHICPKAVAMGDVHGDPDRIRRPLRRRGDGWEEVSWRAAFDEAGARLAEIQRRHGRDAVGTHYGNPIIHNLGAMLYGPLFSRTLASRNHYSASSVDTHAQFVANHLAFGNAFVSPIPDVDRTDFLLLIGSNPAVSNGRLVVAPDIKRRLKGIVARGGEFVVVDPRRTQTASLASQHLFIRPGTDVFLLIALARLAFEHRRPGSTALPVRGWSELEHVVGRFSLDDCVAATGIDADEMRNLANRWLGAKRAAVHGCMGISVQDFAGLSAFLVNALNTIAGHLDRPGGAMFTRPALDAAYPPPGIGLDLGFDRYRSRVRGWPEVNAEFPVSTLADEILTPGDGQIRGMLTFASNPVLSTPNGRRLDRALAGLEYMVSIDYYMNETTRHAHLILPPVTGLQREHYDAFLNGFAARDVAKWVEPAFPKGPDEQHDWEIFVAIAERVAALRDGPRSLAALKVQAMKRLGPAGMVDLAIRTGPRGAFRGGLSLAKIRRHPHGLDLGPLAPRGTRRFPRRHAFVDLAPPKVLAELDRLQTAPRTDAPLVLIGRRQLRGANTWLHNTERLMRGKHRCTAILHPDDATRFGIADGDQVEVASKVGAITLPAELSDEIMPGVISIPHGFGHDREGTRNDVARRNAGVSINDLTDAAQVDELSGASVLNGVPVTVKPHVAASAE